LLKFLIAQVPDLLLIAMIELQAKGDGQPVIRIVIAA
jgi:hypothetical protein